MFWYTLYVKKIKMNCEGSFWVIAYTVDRQMDRKMDGQYHTLTIPSYDGHIKWRKLLANYIDLHSSPKVMAVFSLE